MKKQRWWGWTCLELAGLFLAMTTHAKEVTLFTPSGAFASGYNAKVAALEPNDEIVFSDGTRFTVETVINAGSQTKILAVKGGKALRIPLRSEYVLQRTLDDFKEGYDALKEGGVPTVKVGRSLKGEFVEVDKLDSSFIRVDKYIRDELPNQNAAGKERFWESMRRFGVNAEGFSSIADLKPDQLFFSPEHGLRLVDWGSYHETARYSDSPSIFDDREFKGLIPEDLRSEVRHQVRERRLARGLRSRPPSRLRCLWRQLVGA